MHDECSQRVPVGGQENGETLAQLGDHLIGPVGQNPRNDIFQTFARRKQALVEQSIAAIVRWMLRAVRVDRGWWDVETASPDLGLLRTMAFGRLFLVETLKRSVMPLVETPGASHRKPDLSHFGQSQMLGDDSTFENRRVRCVEEQTFVEHQASCGARFGAPFVRERNVVPAREQVGLVPRAFSVTQDDESPCHGMDDTGRVLSGAECPEMSSLDDAAVFGPVDVPTFSISELVDAINATLDDAFESGFWIWGEISGLSVKNRHTYFTLVEQDDNGSGKKAQLSVNLWAGESMKLQPILNKSGLELVNGVKVRIFGTLNFYGPFGRLSLIMRGIDPRFTLGEIALQRDELVRRLKESGDYDRNREIELSPVPLRLGVVTSGSSAAWADFRNQIEGSGIGFHLVLADVVVQGDSAVGAVSKAIDALAERSDLDAIVVIRGGGSKTDLSTFDAEPIARAIARSALPVFTGIGHEIDVSVADEVAHESHKTPTACAVALIDKVRMFIEESEELWSAISQLSTTHLERADGFLNDVSRDIVIHTRSAVDRADERLTARVERITRRIPQFFDERDRELDNVATRIRLLDPKNVLARGWSITRTSSGRIIRSIDDIAVGEDMQTVVSDGSLMSTVSKVVRDSIAGGEPAPRNKEM